jgi:hypothetical protein
VGGLRRGVDVAINDDPSGRDGVAVSDSRNKAPLNKKQTFF